MATCPSACQCRPSRDSAYLIACRIDSTVGPQARLEPYHIRKRSPSHSTQGYDRENGSTSLRSSTGARPCLRNSSPLLSEVASPMLLRHGTVTPRFQPT